MVRRELKIEVSGQTEISLSVSFNVVLWLNEAKLIIQVIENSKLKLSRDEWKGRSKRYLQEVSGSMSVKTSSYISSVSEQTALFGNVDSNLFLTFVIVLLAYTYQIWSYYYVHIALFKYSKKLRWWDPNSHSMRPKVQLVVVEWACRSSARWTHGWRGHTRIVFCKCNLLYAADLTTKYSIFLV